MTTSERERYPSRRNDARPSLEFLLARANAASDARRAALEAY
jgi:hypothetical protein